MNLYDPQFVWFSEQYGQLEAWLDEISTFEWNADRAQIPSWFRSDKHIYHRRVQECATRRLRFRRLVHCHARFGIIHVDPKSGEHRTEERVIREPAADRVVAQKVVVVRKVKTAAGPAAGVSAGSGSGSG
jgi:hypothetical protein